MLKHALSCLRHSLRRVAGMPRAWAVVILLVLFVENQFSPIRQMLVEEGMTLSFPGMAIYMLTESQMTMLLGLGLLMLLFDAPFTDETQRYIVSRAGRGAWALGQVMYVLVMTAIYLLLFLLVLLALQLPWTDWSGGWSSGLEALCNQGAYEYYNTMLDYDPWLMRAYSPMGGLMLSLVVKFLGFSLLALVQYAVNAAGAGRLGFLLAGLPLLFDSMIEEYFFENVYYFSPVTLTRLTTLDYGDEMGRPPVWYALLALAGLTALITLACVRISRRHELQL